MQVVGEALVSASASPRSSGIDLLRVARAPSTAQSASPLRSVDGSSSSVKGDAAHAVLRHTAGDDSWWQTFDDTCGQRSGLADLDGARALDRRTMRRLTDSGSRANGSQVAAIKSHRLASDDTWWQGDDTSSQRERPEAGADLGSDNTRGDQRAHHDGTFAPVPASTATKSHRLHPAYDDPCWQPDSGHESRGSQTEQPNAPAQWVPQTSRVQHGHSAGGHVLVERADARAAA